MRTFLLIFVLGAALVGCGPSSVLNGWDRAEISDSESLRAAAIGSAPQVFGSAGLTAAGIINSARQASTGGCPVQKQEGATTTYTGDCTDAGGVAWFGKATETASEPSDYESANYRFEDFGTDTAIACGSGATFIRRLAITGTSVFTGSGEAGGARFNFDLRIDQTVEEFGTCSPMLETWAYSYSGQQVKVGTRTTWNGSGRVGTRTLGTVEVSTQDEVLDSSVCNQEALSGTTTIKGKDTTAVITYDGATDCSELSTVTWTLDGVEMGTVDGITCSTATGAPLGFALLGLLGLGLKRRRS